MDWLFVIGLAISSSIDNLAVGVSYGVRGVWIGTAANLLIAVICFLLSEAGLLFGTWIGTVLPDGAPDLLGAFILFVLGLRFILLALPRRADDAGARDGRTQQAAATWWRLLTSPGSILLASSGRVGWLEAAVLGVALSANALTNALGAGLLGMPATAVALTAALGSFVAVAGGVALGVRVAQVPLGAASIGRYGTAVSGAILLVLAFVNLSH